MVSMARIETSFLTWANEIWVLVSENFGKKT